MNKKYISVTVVFLLKEFEEELMKMDHYELRNISAGKSNYWTTKNISSRMVESLTYKHAMDDKHHREIVISLITKKIIIRKYRKRTKVKDQMKYVNHLRQYGLYEEEI